MSMEHEITKKAADGHLTIAELHRFLGEVGQASPPSSEGISLTARIGFGGGIKSITAKIPAEDPAIRAAVAQANQRSSGD